MYSGAADSVHSEGRYHLFTERSYIDPRCGKPSWVSLEQEQNHYWEHSAATHTAL